MKAAYLLIAHGSKDPDSHESLFDFVQRFRRTHRGRQVEGCFLQFGRPTLPEAIKKCIAAGSRQVFVMPLMMFPGRHVKEDIPRAIQEARRAHPDVDFHYTGPLCDEPAMLDLVGKRLAAWRPRR